ncbi:hypothetical protein CAL65_18860 [Alkalilimnicola ehrlichii]|uniref:Cytochrome c domain-containing protein n=2 Tax=Alkalilimnicola ehrlichii TaxID=351052 RepID=A0A3E0WKY2_9GAMM|nr:hypothetical protein CAL65_18860 [Alkalilimnicola ehrlichii]
MPMLRLSLFITLLCVVSLVSAGDDLVVRGQYLAQVGNCASCHTAKGGKSYAGGHRLGSPFGTFITPNITPAPNTGIGRWSADDLWEALHNGRRPDGQRLYPACPYPSFTRARREDVDAIYAYLQSVPAVEQELPDHRLGSLASRRSLLAVWQALFFTPGTYEANPQHDAVWNRGAYLVEGLGHCMACHAERNRFGATRSGQNIAGDYVQGWYAPSFFSSREAGLQTWSQEKSAALLQHGKAGDAAVLGPMADIVYDSLQHLSDDDIHAMVSYLRSLPDTDIEPRRRPLRLSQARVDTMLDVGRQVYDRSCKDCHGRQGRGTEAAAALAGNRTVLMADPTNLVNTIRYGGYPPSTEGNPRPFGMPPFNDLSDAEIAAVATYIRQSWGNDAAPVATSHVRQDN